MPHYTTSFWFVVINFVFRYPILQSRLALLRLKTKVSIFRSDYLKQLRLLEIESILSRFPLSARVLDVGAGLGWQSSLIASKGYPVTAIDLSHRTPASPLAYPVIDYDGVHIPFPDASFDLVYSSNVLEHIYHIDSFQQELLRVVSSDGILVHVLPTPAWRFWTLIVYLFTRFSIPPAHGEHARNAFCEIYYFSRFYWTQLFSRNGFEITHYTNNSLFYTGCISLGSLLPFSVRRLLSLFLGASCHVFVLKPSASASLSAD